MRRKFKLQSVGIEVTWNCNQRCSYCYLACNNIQNDQKRDMNLDLFTKVLNNIWEYGVRHIYLIGGEPTIHPQFSRLIDVMNRYEWIKKGICTNGVEVNSNSLNLIKENFDYVSVSLRGSRETTERITQKDNSYDHTINFLKKLSLESICKIRIALDLLPEYVEEFEDIFIQLEKNNIRFKHVDLHRIAPIGSADKESSLSLEDYRTILGKIDNITQSEGYNISFEDGLPLCLFDRKYWKYINKCECGISKIWIDPYGNVRRCACSSGNISNILKNKLSECWQSERLKKFRSFSWVDDECKKCKKFEKCFGGCASSRGVRFFRKDILSSKFKAIK